MAAKRGAWWNAAGDQALALLIEDGLRADRDTACRLITLRRQDAAASSNTLGAAVRRMLQPGDRAERQAGRAQQIERLAARRVFLAGRIALAYIEVRRLQQQRDLRAGLLDQFRDNLEIARFRNEAGLASAIDGALAETLDTTTRAELGYSGRQITHALSELANLAGTDTATLAARIGDSGTLPPGIDRDAASLTTEGEGSPSSIGDTLTQALEQSERTVADARAAYREGASPFATLYVAEVAALSVRQAMVDERAARAAEWILQQNVRDTAWARTPAPFDAGTQSGPPPAPAANNETNNCD